MEAVFLDFATVGSDELDISPLLQVLPDLDVFDNTAPGQVVERIADAQVVFANKVRLTKEIFDQTDSMRFVGLTATGVDDVDLLQRCDVVSLHCPLTDDTRDLIGAAELRLMKASAILINTARGGLVDSAALVGALDREKLYAAAIDVLAQEPPVDGDPLLDYAGDNLIITPHIAWATVEARQNAINETALNVVAFLEGGRRNRVI